MNSASSAPHDETAVASVASQVASSSRLIPQTQNAATAGISWAQDKSVNYAASSAAQHDGATRLLPSLSHLLEGASTSSRPPPMSTLTPPLHGGLGGVYTDHSVGASNLQVLTPNSCLRSALDQHATRGQISDNLPSTSAYSNDAVTYPTPMGWQNEFGHLMAHPQYASSLRDGAQASDTRRGLRPIQRGQGHAYSRSCPEEVEEVLAELAYSSHEGKSAAISQPTAGPSSLEFGPSSCLDFVSEVPHSPPSQAEVAQWFAAMVHYIWFNRPDVQDETTSSSQGECLRLHPSPAFVAFVRETLNTTQLSNAVILLALLYIRRVRSQHGQVPGWEGAEYRLAISALMLANKMHEDSSYTSATWSDIVKIPVKELNQMEVELWLAVPSMWTSSDQYFDWVAEVTALSHSREYELQIFEQRRAFGHASMWSIGAAPSGCATARRRGVRRTSPRLFARHSLGNIFESVSPAGAKGPLEVSGETVMRRDDASQILDWTFGSLHGPTQQPASSISIASSADLTPARPSPLRFSDSWRASEDPTSTVRPTSQQLETPGMGVGVGAKRAFDGSGEVLSEPAARRRRRNDQHDHDASFWIAQSNSLPSQLGVAPSVVGSRPSIAQPGSVLSMQESHGHGTGPSRQRSTFEGALTPDVLIAPYAGPYRAEAPQVLGVEHGRSHSANTAPLHYWSLAAGHAYGRANQYLLPPIPGAHQYVPPATVNLRRAEHTPSPLAIHEPHVETSHFRHVPAITSTPYPTPSRSRKVSRHASSSNDERQDSVSPSANVLHYPQSAQIRHMGPTHGGPAQSFVAGPSMLDKFSKLPVTQSCDELHDAGAPQHSLQLPSSVAWTPAPQCGQHDSYRPFVANTHDWPITRSRLGPYPADADSYQKPAFKG
ncbi:PROTEIN CNPPD1 [Ceraceosorus bombacis]|uniref:PROTEIN CNPPD1 n=1 Tax=Ceraceosorus bombacis TaxID=401625 RepID=A0A0P1BE69_9BASI|nr:PROTEIN CNPPD1 [Ceraceosorus bombacis]